MRFFVVRYFVFLVFSNIYKFKGNWKEFKSWVDISSYKYCRLEVVWLVCVLEVCIIFLRLVGYVFIIGVKELCRNVVRRDGGSFVGEWRERNYIGVRVVWARGVGWE